MLKKRDRHEKKGIKWFFDSIRKATKDVNFNAFNPVKDPFIGGMFYFRYPNPKTKERLKYWDAFPLVMPFSILPDGFIGLNFHYLSPDSRKKLLDALIGHKMKKSSRDYINISYKMLKGASKFPEYEKCVHRYLFSRIRSRLVKVGHDEWSNVVVLPLQQWRKGGLS